MSLLSFGAAERTLRQLTRLIVYGEHAGLRAASRNATNLLLGRHLLGAGLAALVLTVAGRKELIPLAMAIVAYALAGNLFSVLSSLFRAFDRPEGLGMVSLLRAVLALALAIGIGVWAGWQADLLAEAGAILALSIALMWVASRWLAPVVGKAAPASSTNAPVIDRASDGIILFLAFLLLNVPLSLDKAAVGVLTNPQRAALYAFCAI